MNTKPLPLILISLLLIGTLQAQEILTGPVEITLTDGQGVGLNGGGQNTVTNADYSLTFGSLLTTSSWGGINFGYLNEVTGSVSMAVGYDSKATGFTSYAFGTFSQATSDYSQAFGKNSIASGQVSTAIGEGIRSAAQFSMSVGRWNVGGGTAKSWISTDPLFEIGNGSNNTNRSNALTVYKSGDAIFHNKLQIEEGLQVGSMSRPQDYIASFEGKILAEGVKVLYKEEWVFPDYVFEEDYQLRPLSEVKDYIADHHHLPEIPSAKEVESEGMSLEAMNILLLKKVEELTLYILDQEDRIKALEKKE